jgi:hypothetical protein
MRLGHEESVLAVSMAFGRRLTAKRGPCLSFQATTVYDQRNEPHLRYCPRRKAICQAQGNLPRLTPWKQHCVNCRLRSDRKAKLRRKGANKSPVVHWNKPWLRRSVLAVRNASYLLPLWSNGLLRRQRRAQIGLSKVSDTEKLNALAAIFPNVPKRRSKNSAFLTHQSIAWVVLPLPSNALASDLRGLRCCLRSSVRIFAC